MTNILQAICNIAKFQNFEIKELYSGKNRANNMGEALEEYIKDSFAGTLNVDDEQKRMQIFNQEFSWLGSQNNPPDIMIKGGDAIEVKKTQSSNSDLALNSSYPKDMISSSSPMITRGCRTCEKWKIKDLIYCVGHTSDEKIKSLWLVYGSIYAANEKIYQRIRNTISTGVNTIPNVEFAESKELGRVNRADPLGITNLRIRGMWQIKNPRKVFDYLHKTSNSEFELVCIIPYDKYNNFPDVDRQKIVELVGENFKISEVKVQNPNNPAKLIDCILIIYSF